MKSLLEVAKQNILASVIERYKTLCLLKSPGDLVYPIAAFPDQKFHKNMSIYIHSSFIAGSTERFSNRFMEGLEMFQSIL
jgi:hypothetical protein